MNKEKLLVSFSGGETSGYMLFWIAKNWKDKFDIKVVFANTGEENEETLIFAEKCAEHFDVEIIWVEAVFHKKYGKGTTHRIVDFKTATRSSRLFKEMCEVYGIPNQAFPHCNRELKLAPIKSYLKSIGWSDYYTAIGIRSDEVDRINKSHKKNKLLYPLISQKPITKPHVNFFWNLQPFRLNLKGYEGNCKVCWKKSDIKLWTIAKENVSKFDGFIEIENKYSSHIPLHRSDTAKKVSFYRRNRTALEIIEESKKSLKTAIDDSKNINYQSNLLDDESCDIFSECYNN